MVYDNIKLRKGGGIVAEKERLVFAGYYKRYDGKHIFVATMAKDYESQKGF